MLSRLPGQDYRQIGWATYWLDAKLHLGVDYILIFAKVWVTISEH